MGMNVLSLFDGMSCGHLGLDKSNTEVNHYVASEVKEFAISHTAKKYPGTIQAGDVTRLHYEDGKMYRNCNRLVVTNGASVLSEADYQANKSCFFTKDGIRLVNITGLTFDKDFDTNNQILANYKDAGLILNASTLNDEALAFYQNNGFEILPNGEIAKWELGEMVFEGQFDMLMGGSPCQDFSLASAANGGKYGLEGSKSRLFFDYLRLKNEVNPTYFFLENVQMKSESKAMLDSFLGVYGIPFNSNKLSIQHRPRVYWTNLCDQAPMSDKTPEEIDFQNYQLRTLEWLEWGMYVKRFPGSYVGYAEGTQEANKGGFEFDETITEHTKVSDNGTMEGTKACIREHVRWNFDGTPNLSFTEEEASEIANFPQNRWVRKELETLYGRPVTDREIVEEIHRNLFEAIVKKSPSRDGMRYGKEVNGKKFSHCKDITNESKMSCITRKQDRFPNSGLIEFGPYCRFITKLEICKGQTVDYAFLADLSYEKIQDVCGDGWTVDVIASFFKHIGCTPIPLQTIEKPQKETEDNKTMGRRKTLVSDIFNESELEKETNAASSIKEDEIAKSLPFETNLGTMNISSEEVLNAIRKVLGMEALGKVQQELFGWDKIKQVNKSNVPSFVKESIEQEVKEALLGSYITKEIREKALWIIQGN